MLCLQQGGSVMRERTASKLDRVVVHHRVDVLKNQSGQFLQAHAPDTNPIINPNPNPNPNLNLNPRGLYVDAVHLPRGPLTHYMKD